MTNMNNRANNLKLMNQISLRIKKLVKQYSNLNAQCNHYIHTKETGNCLFNFLNHEYDTLINYGKNIRNRLDSVDRKLAKDDDPFLYDTKSRMYLTLIIKMLHHQKGSKNLDHINEHNILIELNDNVNQYLFSMNIIKYIHGQFTLSKHGQKLIDKAPYYLTDFLARNNFTYYPNVPYLKILLPALDDLKMVNKHQELNNCFGLMFITRLISKDIYSDFCSHNDSLIQIDPMPYLNDITLMYDAYFNNPEQTYSHETFTRSKANIVLMNDLINDSKDIYNAFAKQN